MAITVYRQSDRIPLEISGVKFSIKPLSYFEKMEITKAISVQDGTQLETILETTKLLMKFSVKEVDGIIYPDGTPLKLNFDDSGNLVDESINEMLSMELTKDLNNALGQFVNGVPEHIVDENGKQMKNVKIIPLKGVPSKKK